MTTTTSAGVLDGYGTALDRRALWEPLWQECYAYALPGRSPGADNPSVNQAGYQTGSQAGRAADAVLLYDGTAPDGVDQLASSLLGELTPPWGQWFALEPGPEASPGMARRAGKSLDMIGETVRSHFERSNFAVEMHQCFLDLVTAGTACLLFEEAPPGSASAFRFTAVPLNQVAFAEGDSGQLDTTFRRTELDPAAFRRRFAESGAAVSAGPDGSGAETISVIEAVKPAQNGFSYTAIRTGDDGRGPDSQVLAEGTFRLSPFLNFRWLKAPGEIYGRSPVMKALPDIKTANKVVELVLKNASIAVTGIWQADDDGVLNPANIRLIPGAIIPKAVGSQGLSPLKAPGDFDLSQIVLEDLRRRIRSALLVENLGQVNAPRMTATEVLERSAEITRLLGATYGRLQSELLGPLMERALSILSRRGDIPAVRVDGRAVSMTWRSPLARSYSRHGARDALSWIDSLRALGPEALAQIDPVAAAHWLAKAFDIPESLLRAEAAAMDDARRATETAAEAATETSAPQTPDTMP